ncbi:MAG: polysaccharide biosynthesis tyrosine autokinase, partial [Bacteroidetes bacterium]
LDFGISYYLKEGLKTRQTYHYAPFEVQLDSSHVQIVGAKFFVRPISDTEYEIEADEKSAEIWNIAEDALVHELEPFVFNKRLRFGQPYTDQNLSFTLHRNPDFEVKKGQRFYFVIHGLKDLAERYQSALKVEAVSKEARLLNITSEGPVVSMQNQFINTLLNTYIQNDLEKQREIGRKMLMLIDEQLTGVTDSLRKAEFSLRGFRAGTNIVDIGVTSKDLTDQLTELERQRAALAVAGQYYEYVLEDIQADNSLAEVVAPASTGIEDPLLTSLLVDLARLKQERAAIRLTAKERSPKVQNIDAKINNVRQAILKNVNTSIRANNIAISNVNERIEALRTRLRRLPESERILTNIKRNFDHSSEVHKYLLQKRAETAIALATDIANKFVVDEAKQVGSGPVSPKVGLIYAVAFVLSLGLPLAIMLVYDFFNEKISGDQDIEACTNIPILGYIARYEKSNNYIIEKDSRTSFAESFRSLRVKMLFVVEGDKKKVIGVTSSSSGEGKTFCATNLAATLAHAGKQTLLIDTDLRRPKVQTYFRTEHHAGLSDFLCGEVDYVNEIIHSTHIENLHIIPAGNPSNNPTDLISNSRMKELVEACMDEYDHIIFDTPPIGLVSDYLILMHLTDYNIYVVRHNVTEVADLKLINELFETGKIQNIGLLLNGVASLSDYGYLDTDYGINGYVKKGKKRKRYEAIN